jgi:hypothetical protein
MSPWTKAAAAFSILASIVTIYNVAVRPKDAPPIWNSLMASVGKSAKSSETCGKVRKPAWPEHHWSVRIAPGNEHKEIAKLAPGDNVVIISEAGNWIQLREQQGLGASLQGWAPAKSIEKATCATK